MPAIPFGTLDQHVTAQVGQSQTGGDRLRPRVKVLRVEVPAFQFGRNKVVDVCRPAYIFVRCSEGIT
jgi:hypothetical protein